MLLVILTAFVAFVIAENRLAVYTALATGGELSVTGGADQPGNL